MAITDFTDDVVLFTPGRAPGPLLAVVLHDFCSGLEMLDNQMARCPRPRPAQSPGCHTSFHYGVDGCTVHQYVLNANTAWGFGLTAPTCPEPICPPDPCASCTGLTADQYQPDLNTGIPPVLPAFVAGVDGTANNNVVHVALAGTCSVDPFGCCPVTLTSSNAYACLIRSLCDIFVATGLTPSASTLLVHCGELPCFDVAQAVIDILACINAPEPVVPPCLCAPTTEQLCSTLATLPVSEVGTLLVLGADCQFHPSADAFAVAALDTTSINTTVTEAPANTFTVSGAVIVSPDAGNSVELRANGVFADRGALLVAPIANAGTIDPTSGNDVFVYSDVGVGAVTLANPIAGEKTDLCIKNISVSTLTVAAASLIDGVGAIVLDGTIPAGYPFGNNGGESVHLVFDVANTTWYVL